MSRTVLFLVLASACGSPSASWKLLHDAEPAALLSVWGSDVDDVWVTGGRADLNGAPVVLHDDHGTWSRLDPGQTGIDLWWVFGLNADDVYFGGSGGTILHYHAGAFDKMTTPRTGTIFGIWGADDHDLWAVGDGGAAGAIVWHYNGTQWTEPALPPGVPSRVFKVHGQWANEVWMSCADGSTLHWDGNAIVRETTGVAGPLFSIVTVPGGAIAVGGNAGDGKIAERDDAGWSVAPFGVPSAWRGAAVRDTDVFAVGEFGTVAHRDAGAWSIVHQRLTTRNFHAAWVDPDGGLWAVGGDFDRVPLTEDGVLAYYGTDSISEVTP